MDNRDVVANAELHRLRMGMVAALLFLLSPFIFLIVIVVLTNSFVAVNLGSSPLMTFEEGPLGLVLGVGNTLNGLEQNALVVWMFLAIPIGFGSLIPLAGIRSALKNQIALDMDNTVILSRREKLNVILPWWLMVGGTLLAGGGMAIVLGTQGTLADYTRTDQFLDIAALTGGVSAAIAGYFLARRNVPFWKRVLDA